MTSLFKIVSLAQYFVCISISIFATITLSYLLYCQSKYRERLISIPILINMITWIVTAVLNFPYMSSAMYSWFTGEVNSNVLFWSGASYLAATTAASISVLFLLLDRCLILIGSSWLNEKKSLLHKLNVGFVIIDFFLVLGIFAAFGKADDQTTTTCQTFPCITSNRARPLYIVRIVYGSLNTIVASVFAMLLYRYNRKRNTQINTHFVVGHQPKKSSQSSRSNFIAGINVVSQIAFNFIPNLNSFLVLQIFDVMLSTLVGPTVSTLTQIDLLSTTLVYLVIVGGRVMAGRAVSSTVGPITVVQRS